MNDAVIRDAHARDIEAICDFGSSYIADHYRPLIGEDAAQAQVVNWWNEERISQAVGKGLVTVAELSGELVGVVELGQWDGAPVVWKLYVHPDHRGRGLGARLLDHVVEQLPSDVECLQIEHFQANERAGRFYDCEGFRVTRIEENESNPEMSVVWRTLELKHRAS